MNYYFSFFQIFTWRPLKMMTLFLTYFVKIYLIREEVGLNPQTPQKWLGALMLPPMSLPQPKMEPPAASKAPSPLEEPPGILSGSCGFPNWPWIGFADNNTLCILVR